MKRITVPALAGAATLVAGLGALPGLPEQTVIAGAIMAAMLTAIGTALGSSKKMRLAAP